MVEKIALKIHSLYMHGVLKKSEYEEYMERLGDVVLYGIHLPNDFDTAFNSIMY